LKAALNHAIEHGKASGDRAPWRAVSPFKGVNTARCRYLTIGEAQRLINAASGDFRPLVQAALATGARYQELARLRVEDFNPDAGTLLIRQSKSGKSRHVILTEEGASFFEGLAAGRPGSELLLGREWKPSQQARRMQAACKQASISPPIGLHGLRHTWASLAVMGGVPLLVVAKNLGHSDTRMVEKHCGHLAPSFIADAIRAGAPRFGLKPPKIVRLT
jgi:integrase